MSFNFYYLSEGCSIMVVIVVIYLLYIKGQSYMVDTLTLYVPCMSFEYF